MTTRATHHPMSPPPEGPAGRCAALFGPWQPRPHVYLRPCSIEAVFLLKLRSGAIHLCQLYGNLPTDRSLKALRFTDCHIFRLENLHGASCILLP